MNRVDSTWPGLTMAAPWPTPDVPDNAPVCFVKRMPGDVRIAHVVCPDNPPLIDAARELMAVALKRQAVHNDEPIGEGRTYVLRDAYEPGWHIVCAEAPGVAGGHLVIVDGPITHRARPAAGLLRAEPRPDPRVDGCPADAVPGLRRDEACRRSRRRRKRSRPAG